MAITTSEARRDLFGLIERVNLDHTEVEITSKRGSAVLISKDEYDALVETSHLLRSPRNAQRLLSALVAAREGQVTEHDLVDPENAATSDDDVVETVETHTADHAGIYVAAVAAGHEKVDVKPLDDAIVVLGRHHDKKVVSERSETRDREQ